MLWICALLSLKGRTDFRSLKELGKAFNIQKALLQSGGLWEPAISGLKRKKVCFEE